jgi:hypothetical protein
MSSLGNVDVAFFVFLRIFAYSLILSWPLSLSLEMKYFWRMRYLLKRVFSRLPDASPEDLRMQSA